MYVAKLRVSGEALTEWWDKDATVLLSTLGKVGSATSIDTFLFQKTQMIDNNSIYFKPSALSIYSSKIA